MKPKIRQYQPQLPRSISSVTKKEENSGHKYFTYSMGVATCGGVVQVHAAESKPKGAAKGYAFTSFAFVKDGLEYYCQYNKCYSMRYAVTLADRFVKQILNKQ